MLGGATMLGRVHTLQGHTVGFHVSIASFRMTFQPR